MIKNKKAWLRIIEAFMAILIVASVLLIIMSGIPSQPDVGTNVYQKQRSILRQVNLNNSLRGDILQGQTTNIETFIETLTPVSWDFTIRICEVEDVCGLLPSFNIEGEIYVDQILITSNLTDYNPKKLKFFVWVEE